MNLLILYGLIAMGLFTGLIVWILILNFNQKKIPKDDTYFLNYMPQYTNGYRRGKIIEVIQGKRRKGILFMPTDVDKVQAFNNKQKLVIEPQLIWIENDRFVQHPKGSASARTHEAWGLPPKVEDYDEGYKKTEIGQAVMNIVEDKNAIKEEANILRKRINVQTKMLEKTEGEELVDEYMTKSSEIMKDLAKSTGGDKKPTVIGPGGNPQRP